jgi:nitrate/nitrite transporter NarK
MVTVGSWTLLGISSLVLDDWNLTQLAAAFLGALLVRSVEGALSDRLGNFWLLVLGVLFVVTVVLMPNGLFGRILALPPPRRFRDAGTAISLKHGTKV